MGGFAKAILAPHGLAGTPQTRLPGVVVGLQEPSEGPRAPSQPGSPGQAGFFSRPIPPASPRRQVSAEEGAPPPDAGCPQDSRKPLLWVIFFPHHPLFLSVSNNRFKNKQTQVWHWFPRQSNSSCQTHAEHLQQRHSFLTASTYFGCQLD